MSKTIQQIYINFNTPKNLQEHMLRVGSLGKIITDNWTGVNLDNQAIIQTGLLHDVAKPMTFDLSKQAQFGMTEQEINNLEELQSRIAANYGSDEHEVVIKIAQEVGCTPKTIKLLDNLEWYKASELLENNDLESLIPIYCDMRIAPNGIYTLKDRVEDLKNRRNSSDGFDELAEVGLRVEAILQENVSLDLNKINNEILESNFKELMQSRI